MAVSAFTLFGELKADTTDFKKGLVSAERQLESFSKELSGVEKTVSKAMQNIGSAMMTAGKALSVAITAPLVATGYAATRSAVSFDTLRTQLKAVAGSDADAKFKELNQLAQKNAGVLTAGAVATYNFLKPMGIAEGTINEVIKAFGKLKSANPEVDLQRMAVNMGQLFDQGFELQDVKELFGNFSGAGRVLQEAFGLSGKDMKTVAKELRDLMANGLTREDFFARFAAGIQNDQFLSNVTDSIAVKFEKMMERIKLALEPLGALIVTNLERWAPYIVAFIEKLSALFSSLSPTMQMTVFAFGAIAAAVGPVLIALAPLVIGFGKLLALLGGSTLAIIIGTVAAALVSLAAQLTIAAAVAYPFYQAWLNNWDLVAQLFESGKARVQAVLDALTAFWAEHGTRITEIATTLYTVAADAIGNAMGIINDYVRLGLQILNGDWTGAWQSLLDVLQGFISMSVQLGMQWGQLFVKVIQAAIPIVVQAFVWLGTKLLTVTGEMLGRVVYFFATLPQQLIALVPQFIAAGTQIISAIWQGIRDGFNRTAGFGGELTARVNGGPSNPFSGLIQSFQNMFSGSGMLAGAAGGTFSPTVLALNNVQTKLKGVENSANKALVPLRKVLNAGSPMTAAQKFNREITGTIRGINDGKGGSYDLAIRSVDTLLSSRDQSTADAVRAAVEAAIRETRQKDSNRLEIDIKDDSQRTSIGATSANVNAKYKNL